MTTRRFASISLALTVAAAIVLRGQQPAPSAPALGLAPDASLKTLTTAPGLEVTLFAAEPDLLNPTSLAIDERGRIWVAEGVNYRAQNPRPAGDRIVILEDTNGDGKADKTKVFDQTPEMKAPLGIAVFGDKVIVSQAPDLILYTKDSDDRILKKEILLTGWKGVNHDHGLHKVVFGPDGKLYFNTGNAGMDVTDRSGTRVLAGNGVGTGPENYFGGVPLRVNLDGTGLTVLAQNFRNIFMLAIDAFGDIWQTDNDDDGNAQTRLTYVFEGGNYGYSGPYGRAWRTDDGTHWHTELPGVVPIVERLGAGAPAGIVTYEGTLLPERFRGKPLHAENSKRSLRGYLSADDGAGYSVKIEDALYSKTDFWFRPSDVAVAPDGAVFVADWNDPLTGGHAMGDPSGEHGRIFRLAPPGHKSRVPALDLKSATGLSAALSSPNQSVFYLAHQTLSGQGLAALPVLEAAWKQKNPVLRARALWLLGAIGQSGAVALQEATKDPDPRFRLLALRVMRANGADMVAASQALVHDRSAQVRREIALLLQDHTRMTPAYLVGDQKPVSTALLNTLVELSKQYDGKDRWYLEALGIAARGREDALFAQLRETYPGKFSASLATLAWEFRPKTAIPYLVAAMDDQALPVADRLIALHALAAMQWPEAAQAVESRLQAANTPAPLFEEAFAQYRHQLVSLWTDSTKSTALPSILRKGLATPATQAKAIEAVAILGDAQYGPDLVALAKNATVADSVRAAALEAAITSRAVGLADLDALWRAGPTSLRAAAVRAMGATNAPDIEARVRAVILSDAPNEVRTEALRLLIRTASGLNALSDLEEKGQLAPELKSVARGLVNGGGGRGGGGGGGARGGGPVGGVPNAPANPGAAAGAPGVVAAGGQPALAAATPAAGGGPGGGGRGAAGPGGRGGGAPADPAMTAARERAIKLFPPLVTAANAALPGLSQMEKNYRADATAGRRVFESAVVNCSACHSLGGPKKLGPDLSSIGLKYSKQALLDQILNPSASIAPDFVVWNLQTSQGSVSGFIADETADTLIVKLGPQEERRLKPSDITARRPSGLSMMPEGLLSAMTPQQVVDLLEYLQSLKGQAGPGR